MGEIYLVATPIGNLGDITLRAIEILKEADLIAAEDTRQTLKLLNHFNIKKPLISYHQHNRNEAGEKLIKKLKEGLKIALVSDAGTPGISDPGEDIVRLCVEEGIDVYAVPGPVAGIYALTVSGLNTEKFVFEGFIDRENKPRRERLDFLKDDERTLIIYEAPHRLQKTLSDLKNAFGNRRVAICRELTKRHEEIIRCTLDEGIAIYNEKTPKGEFVLIVEGRNKEDIQREKEMAYENMTIKEHILLYIENGNTKKEAVKLVCKERNLPKSEVYKESIDL